jgi:uroporphyrinogen decarboxylase
MNFIPDYHHFVDAVQNRKPSRLPMYEHFVDHHIIEIILGVPMHYPDNNASPEQIDTFYKNFCNFHREMTYDTIFFEASQSRGIPEHGAIYGGKPGPIQNRKDFDNYNWEQIPSLFWKFWEPRLDALCRHVPEGMKLVGGIGMGVFELSEDFVGYEYLCMMQFDDPELFAKLYVKIGDTMHAIWSRLLERYGDHFCVCRFGDDLGFKNSTLLSPATIKEHILPQHRRLISLIKSKGKPFIFHSCGCIFDVMEEIIANGIDAKHSNEDQIAPFDEWISRYGDRIGLLGGIDLNILCLDSPEKVKEKVIEMGTRFRKNAKGFALGSGNSIPDYIPAEGYLAMVEAVKEIRRREMA